MLSALLVVLAASQPQTVTFSHPCAHSSVVLEALGREIGVTMRPSGSVVDDYFAIKLTDQPVGEAIRVIAETLNAEWVPKTGVTYLTRGAKQHKEEEIAETEALRLSIRKYLENKPPEFDRDKIKETLIRLNREMTANRGGSWAYPSEDIRKYSPDQRAGYAIVSALGEDALISVSVGDSKTYALNSDGSGDMPAKVRAVFKDYIAERQAFSDIAYSVGAEQVMPYFSMGMQYEGTIQRTRLSVTRNEGYIQVMLHETAGQGQQTSYSSTRSVASFSRERPTVKPPEWPVLEGRLELSETAGSIVRTLLASRYQQAAAIRQNDLQVCRYIATDLVNNEVLALYGDAPIRAMGALSGRDYVALVPDDLSIAPTWASVAETAQLTDVFKRWIRGLLATEDPKTGIYLLRPVFPATARKARLDRAALSMFAKGYIQQGHLTLDGLADLAVQVDNEQGFAYHARAAGTLLRFNASATGDWIALRAYGSLNAAQRKTARNGGLVFEWRGLPQSVREAIARSYASRSNRFSREVSPQQNWQPWGRAFYGGMIEDVPSGTLEGAQYRLVVHTNTMLVAKQSQDPLWAYNNLMTAEQLAAYRTAHIEYYENIPDYNNVAVVGVERLQLDIYAPNVGHSSFVSQVDTTSDQTQYVNVDKLPEEWKTRILEAEKKIRGGG